MFRRSRLEEVFIGEGSGGDGSRRGALQKLETHLQSLRLTASFCRALSSLVLIVTLIHALGWGGWALLGAMVLAASILAVFGVAIPHAWALYAGEEFLASTLPALMAVRYLLWPITKLMSWFDLPIRRLSGRRDDESDNGESAKQEILHAAVEGEAEGAVDADEREMIESVIELGETHAGEIMTPRTDIFAVNVSDNWREVAARIVEAGHSRVPVYEGDLDKIIGILYAKDLLQYVGRTEDVSLRKILRKPFFVPETKVLDSLLKEFKALKNHMAIVLDEYGGTAGLVTIEDVLEEIVGEITDEYDIGETPLIQKTGPGVAEVDGRTYIDDLNDQLHLDLPEDEDFDTVAGLVFSELGYIPAAGESLDAHGVRFSVLQAEERKITRLRVEKLAGDAVEPAGEEV